MKIRRCIYSFCLGTVFSLLSLIPIFLLEDFRNYPLTSSDVDSMMSAKIIVSQANVQGSRVYITADKSSFTYHTFETSSVLTNRFRPLHQLEFDGKSPFFGVILGRWNNFRIVVTDMNIEYYLLRGRSAPAHRRIQTKRVVAFASSIVIFTMSAHRILSARDKKGDEAR